jgi:hypothetical protein
MLGTPSEQLEQTSVAEPRPLPDSEQPQPVTEVMEVKAATEQAGIRVFRGRLRQPPEDAYEKLKQAFPDQTAPLMEEDEQFEAAITLLPKSVRPTTLERPVRSWIHWLLFGALRIPGFCDCSLLWEGTGRHLRLLVKPRCGWSLCLL